MGEADSTTKDETADAGAIEAPRESARHSSRPAPPETVAPSTEPMPAPVTERLPEPVDATVKTEARAPSEAPRASAPPMPKAPSVPPARTSVAPRITDAHPIDAYETLARSPRLPDLVALTAKFLPEMARLRATNGLGASVLAAAEEAKLGRSDAETPYGNALDVLSSGGGQSVADRALASALYAHALAEGRREDVVPDLLWLATHTSFDAMPLLDRALGEDATTLWTEIAARVKRIDGGHGGALGRAEALVGCAGLAASTAPTSREIAARLASGVRDPVLVRLLGAPTDAPAAEGLGLEGEMLPAPRGPFVTVLLAFTGVLLAVHTVRLVARLALAYRRPAELSLTDTAVRLKTRTELLGRTLTEREHVVLRAGLVRVVREVRFPRAAFYAGLIALALGSYIGVRAFADGVRAASPSLLLVGLLVVALGIGADFVLGSLVPGTRGRCRISFIPRTGATLCIGDVDARRADDILARLKK
jgi:hypothetical protein